jgi:hypothetical protein
MLAKSMMGLMPELGVAAMIGPIAWGCGSALLCMRLPRGGPVVKGIVFGYER